MDNKEFSRQLEIRTRKFAIAIIKLCTLLPNTPEANVVRYQLTKSGTSVGANYREANRARSKADFSNKIRISEGETNETIYWLEIIEDLNWLNDEIVKPALNEGNELLAIFTSISGKLRK